MLDGSFPSAKVCDAFSYKNAQCSREVVLIHRDAVFPGFSLDAPLISELLCLFKASIALYTFVGERSVGG